MNRFTAIEDNSDALATLAPDIESVPVWHQSDNSVHASERVNDTSFCPSEKPMPLLDRPKSRNTFMQYRFKSAEKWNGTIIDVTHDRFYARIINMKSKRFEEADFPLEDVSEDDKPLVRQGALFIFSIGQQVSPGGTIQRCPRLYFRRIPKWSADEVLDANQKAKKRLKSIPFQ